MASTGNRHNFRYSTLYSSAIKGFQPLSREREAELAKLSRQGDIEARNQLVTANLRFAVLVALRCQNGNTKIDTDDLIQLGNIGLIKAAEKFDPAKGRFTTYAIWWIRREIVNFLMDRTQTIRVPRDPQKLYGKISRAYLDLSRTLGRKPEIKEVAKFLKEPESKIIQAMLTARLKTDSLDDGLENEEGKSLSLIERLSSRSTENPELILLTIENLEISGERIKIILERLDKTPFPVKPRDKDIFLKLFGLHDGSLEPIKMDDIASEYGFSRPLVHKITSRVWSLLDNRKFSTSNWLIKEVNRVRMLSEAVEMSPRDAFVKFCRPQA